jgi:hypothetical protein
MIDAYFHQIEQTLNEFPNIRSTTIQTKQYSVKQGYIRAVVVFDNGCTLEFVEVKDTDIPAKMKYRYQYMSIEKQEIFRYDNAPHHRDLPNFPHHKHANQQVMSCQEPTLFEVLLEIARYERQETVGKSA